MPKSRSAKNSQDKENTGSAAHSERGLIMSSKQATAGIKGVSNTDGGYVDPCAVITTINKNDCLSVLSDFGIAKKDKDIPIHIKTIRQLEQWQRQIISDYLDGVISRGNI
jgi:hypothetical protein